jgi:hypothetical protein
MAKVVFLGDNKLNGDYYIMIQKFEDFTIDIEGMASGQDLIAMDKQDKSSTMNANLKVIE